MAVVFHIWFAEEQNREYTYKNAENECFCSQKIWGVIWASESVESGEGLCGQFFLEPKW